jgi:hypothetical protein
MNDKTATSPVVRPHWRWFALLDGGLVLLCAVSFSDGAYGCLKGVGSERLPRQAALRLLLGGAVVIHVVEAMAAARGAQSRGLSVRGWTSQTLVVGFPSLLVLRRQHDVTPAT